MITGGLFEVCHGVDDLASALDYWRSFGFRAGPLGRLDAGDAKKLYGVNADLESLRLQHLDADHGLIRLMHWHKQMDEGIGMSPFRTLGARWITTLTEDAYALLNHCEMVQRRGDPIWVMAPVFSPSHYVGQDGLSPFRTQIPGLREGAFILPHARHVYIQRYGFERPNYGTTDPDSLFKASQNIHSGLVLQDDDGPKRRFYEETLGLKMGTETVVPYEKAMVSRQVMSLDEGEPQRVTDVDDLGPQADPLQGRSGRLKLFRLDDSKPVADKRDVSRPGYLGPCLYTWRARDVAALRARVVESSATAVTEVTRDEFGGDAFSFEAPDGYFWTILSAR